MKYGGSVLGLVSMVFVVGVAVATSVPAASLVNPQAVDAGHADSWNSNEQEFEVGESALTVTGRDQYGVIVLAPVTSSGSGGGYGGKECSAGSAVADEAKAFSWPYPNGYRLSDVFGPRGGGFHKGVDMLNPPGTPVHAIADGVVIGSSGQGGTAGVYLAIAHRVSGEAVCSMYMHFQEGSLTVIVGQKVTAGQVIGLTGDTGNATAFHTHFELYGADGARFDPMPWMSAHAG